MRLPKIMLAAALATALVACSGGGAENTSPTASPTSSPPPTLAPGVTPGPGVTDTEIRLGMTSDLLGDGGTPYGVFAEAIQAYFAKVNAENEGVCGRNLVLVARDDKYDPNSALAQTKALVKEDQVLAVFGDVKHTGAPVGGRLPQRPERRRQHRRRRAGPVRVYRLLRLGRHGTLAVDDRIHSELPDGRVILTGYINKEIGGKKVGVLYKDDEFGNDYLAVVKPVARRPGSAGVRPASRPGSPGNRALYHELR